MKVNISILIKGVELKELRLQVESFYPQISSKVRSLQLCTAQGAARHAKSLNTDTAWDVYECLEDTYFNVENNKPIFPPHPLPINTDNRLSLPSDPERKEYTAMLNAWVGVAPIHYAGARAIANAHFGVKTIDEMTVGAS